MGVLRYVRLLAIRRLVVVAALGSFLAATIGVPIAIRQPGIGKDRSRRFMCQDHQCGCTSAEQCWRSCCCFTNVQKLAWAAEHDVVPPDYVFAAAVREQSTAVARSCCHSHSNDHVAESHDCHADVVEAEGADEVAEGTWSVGFVSAVQARRCQGQAELWLSLGAVPPPAKVEPRLEQFVCGSVESFTPSLAGILLSPATPPPRA